MGVETWLIFFRAPVCFQGGEISHILDVLGDLLTMWQN